MVHRGIFVLFLIATATQLVATCLKLEPPSREPGFEMVFWILAALTTLTGLGQRLPLQNVLTIATVMAGLSFGAESLNARTSIPFGPRHFTDMLGDKPEDEVPWIIPLIWIVAIINARGIIRLALRPWRKTTYYGFWVIGWTAAAVAAFSFGLEPFATHAKRYWFWGDTRLPFSYYGSALIIFLSTAGVTIAILAFATPWLINKQPVKQPPDYHPLAIWLSLHVLFLGSHIAGGRFLAALATLGVSVPMAILAIRGARWSKSD